MYIAGPILAGRCTLHELRTVYTLDDLVFFNHLGMLADDIAREQQERQRDQ